MTVSIAIYNLKGGVGKTATAVNLSYLSALEGYRTLLWDLDPQGAASYYLRVDEEAISDADAMLKKKKFPERIIGSDYLNLDIVSSNLSLRHMDVALSQKKSPQNFFKALIENLPEEYDLVFLDCAPNISFVSDNIFELADFILVPIIPTHLSIRAYEQIVPFAKRTEQLIPFFSMVDRRRRLHRDMITQFARNHPELISRYIPYSSDIERMGLRRAPIHEYGQATPGAQAFSNLWTSLTTRTRLGELTSQF